MLDIFSNAVKKRKFLPYKRVLPHIVLVALVLGYCVISAFTFQWLESRQSSSVSEYDPSGKILSSTEAEVELWHLWKRVLAQRHSKGNVQFSISLQTFIQKWRSAGFPALEQYVQVSDKQKNQWLCGDSIDGHEQWTFWSSFLFAFSVITTIGYGNVAPRTLSGRLFCMFLALTGIPLTMLCLANIGKFLTLALQRICRSLLKFCFRLRTINRQDADLQNRELYNRQATSDSNDIVINTILTILLFAIWVLLGTAVTPYWENTSYFEAGYFIVISLTSVGLGDIYPVNQEYLVPMLIYLFLGLAITSMAIEVLSQCLMKLHFAGTKIENVADNPVWINGHHTTIGYLMNNIFMQVGLDEKLRRSVFENLDLMVKKTVGEECEQMPSRRNSFEMFNGLRYIDDVSAKPSIIV